MDPEERPSDSSNGTNSPFAPPDDPVFSELRGSPLPANVSNASYCQPGSYLDSLDDDQIFEDSLTKRFSDSKGHFRSSTRSDCYNELLFPTSFCTDDFLAESNPEFFSQFEELIALSDYPAQSENSSMTFLNFRTSDVTSSNERSEVMDHGRKSIVEHSTTPQDLERPSQDVYGLENPIKGITRLKGQPGIADPNIKPPSCVCKKTRCLKINCVCFQGSNYCSEACSCEQCFNKKEYEDLIQNSKNFILSVKENAFSPKVVSVKETGTSVHITGCNCIKSLCNKNYCQCFKAGVGCSTKCRCKECRNEYGKINLFG